MTDAGVIKPATPTWPSRPADSVVRRKRPPPDGDGNKRDPRRKKNNDPEQDAPHVDEYA